MAEVCVEVADWSMYSAVSYSFGQLVRLPVLLKLSHPIQTEATT
jgi:hypothetical protein